MKYKRFFETLCQQRNPSHELEKHFHRLLKKEIYKSHTKILNKGEVCDKIWFIVKGSAIAYSSKKGKKSPFWFWNENEVMVPIQSFFKQSPINSYIEVRKKSTLVSISYDAVRILTERFPDFNLLLMDLIEKFQHATEKRISGLTGIEPYKRYELLGNESTFIARKEPVEEEEEMVVSAFVGVGAPSYKDGIGEAAAFNKPVSITTDTFGNIFVVDNVNLRIRKVTPEGVVSTFAGSGILGYLDGPAASAQFNYHGQITSDAQNNLYLTDPENSCIRKITPEGIFSTIAGAPGRSYSDGPITTAGIEIVPYADITVDAFHNIYFLDRNGVRKISNDGIVSTIVHNGSSNIIGSIKSASIPNPQNICTDRNGNIYVSSHSQSNTVIFKINTEGMVSVYAGVLGGDEGYQLGIAQTARFLTTRGMETDISDNIFILDNNHVITKITPDGFVKFVAGTQYTGSARPFIPGKASQAVFYDSTDIAVDSNGIIYILEYQGSSIRKISFSINKKSKILLAK